jgi:hypothetical protein
MHSDELGRQALHEWRVDGATIQPVEKLVLGALLVEGINPLALEVYCKTIGLGGNRHNTLGVAYLIYIGVHNGTIQVQYQLGMETHIQLQYNV